MAALLGACTLASAQDATGLRLGVGAGASDHGMTIKGQIGDDLAPPFLRGLWRWEGQAVRFGSEDDVRFGAHFQRNAWALGASAMPLLPLTRSVTALGKLGLHYRRSPAGGPGLSGSKAGVKLGFGAGLLWQASSKVGLTLALENIGGSAGDLITLGVEVPL